MPDPTPAEIAREAEAETSIFNQAANIDKLLNMLKNFDIQKDNLADNEEVQVHNLFKFEIDDIKVTLGIISVQYDFTTKDCTIDRQVQPEKGYDPDLLYPRDAILTRLLGPAAELVQMNESYVKARNMFDQMMEESLAKHNPSRMFHTPFP